MALGSIPYGGADFGENAAVASAVGNGDDAAFYRAWVAAADRLQLEAEEELRRGRRVGVRELYMRASGFYGYAYRPLFGEPVDSRLLDGPSPDPWGSVGSARVYAFPAVPFIFSMDGPASNAIMREPLGWNPTRRRLIDALDHGNYFAMATRAKAGRKRPNATALTDKKK